jgi:L-rhamnose mutarotase
MATFKVAYTADLFVYVKSDSIEEALEIAAQTPIGEWSAYCTPLIVQQLNKEVN